MAIEGVKGTYIIPIIKKDRQTDADQGRKKKMDPKKERKKDDDEKKENKGKVDIRI